MDGSIVTGAIRLDDLIVSAGFATSRSGAQRLTSSGCIRLNGSKVLDS